MHALIMRKPSALRVLLLGAILIGAAACSTGDPNISTAEDALSAGNYAQAIASVDAAIQADPSNTDAYLLKGEILAQQAGAADNAQQRTALILDMVETYRQVVEIDPSLQGQVDVQLLLAYNTVWQRGAQAFNEGSQNPSAYGDAALYFQAAAAIQPDSANAYINQAYALINADRPAEAIVPFEAAIETGNVNSDVYVLLGEAYAENNRVDDAIRLLQQARARFPGNADVEAQLLNTYVQAGRIDEAVAEYRTAIQANPNSPLLRYNLGSLLLQTEQYDEAIVELTRAAELEPNNGNALYNLGAAYTNAAIDINEQIVEMEDQLRAQRSTLSQTDIQARQQEIDRLAAQRRQMFEQAITPLERARTLLQGQNQSIQGVCAALFQSYVQTGQTQQAESVSQCAGY
jgi:tetratricopeptide (TPR) repeat protein